MEKVTEKFKICDVNVNVWFDESTSEWVGEVNYKVYYTSYRWVEDTTVHRGKTFREAQYGAIAMITKGIFEGIHEMVTDENYFRSH